MGGILIRFDKGCCSDVSYQAISDKGSQGLCRALSVQLEVYGV